MNKPIRITDIQLKKQNAEKISMLTAYDYTMAKLIDAAGIDMILVGDSLGNVVLGYEDTLSVTLNDMIHHCAAVARGTKHALLVCDMPFGSYQVNKELAVKHAIQLMAKGRAHAVKLEGGQEIKKTVRKIVDAGIPVMGHIGLRPQSVHQQGGYQKQGKTDAAKQSLIEDARALQDSGAFALVLECVDADLTGVISEEITIPIIGIGSGKACDGQVLVSYDLLGLNSDYVPGFVKPTANLKDNVAQALELFIQSMQG